MTKPRRSRRCPGLWPLGGRRTRGNPSREAADAESTRGYAGLGGGAGRGGAPDRFGGGRGGEGLAQEPLAAPQEAGGAGEVPLISTTSTAG